MPFKSAAQRRWMYKFHPRMAAEWQKKTGKKKLPARLHPKKTVARKTKRTPRSKR